MENTGISITEYGDGYTKENMVFAYSEEEKQENKEYREHTKLIYTPEFIPYYIGIQKQYNLTQSETILYGFIRFYLNNSPNGKFYFTDNQLSEILLIGESTISNSVSKLSNLGIIKKYQQRKSSGGTKRLISDFVSYKPETLKYGVCKPGKSGTNNNIINILYIKNIEELKKHLTEEEQTLYKNEIKILDYMFRLSFIIKHENFLDGEDPSLTINKKVIEVFTRLKSMLSRYIPRREDGRLDRNKAIAEAEDRYIYWNNPPRGKKKPTNIQSSLTNWMKPKQRNK